MNVPTLIERWTKLSDSCAAGYISWKSAVLKFDSLVNLFKLEPILGDFVPCDKDGKPMEKPDGYGIEYYGDLHVNDQKKWVAYEKALSRVKWVGWEIEHVNKAGVYLKYKGKITAFSYFKDGRMDFNSGDGSFDTMKTYSQLIDSGIELEATEQTAKDLKLVTTN